MGRWATDRPPSCIKTGTHPRIFTDARIAELDDLPDLGLVTLEKVEVVHYGGKAGR